LVLGLLAAVAGAPIMHNRKNLFLVGFFVTIKRSNIFLSLFSFFTQNLPIL